MNFIQVLGFKRPGVFPKQLRIYACVFPVKRTRLLTDKSLVQAGGNSLPVYRPAAPPGVGKRIPVSRSRRIGRFRGLAHSSRADWDLQWRWQRSAPNCRRSEFRMDRAARRFDEDTAPQTLHRPLPRPESDTPSRNQGRFARRTTNEGAACLLPHPPKPTAGAGWIQECFPPTTPGP